MTRKYHIAHSRIDGLVGSVGTVLLVMCASGCTRATGKPGPVVPGEGTASSLFPEPQALQIPESLTSGDLAHQARMCASYYEDAYDATKSCQGTNVTLKVLEGLFTLGSVATAGIATQVNDATSSGQATKTSLVGTSLVAAALFASTAGFDLWLNCGSREGAQQQLAAERLGHLENAGHLVACAMNAATKPPDSEVSKKVDAAISALTAESAKVAGTDPTLSKKLTDHVTTLKGAQKAGVRKALSSALHTVASDPDVKADQAVSAPVEAAAAASQAQTTPAPTVTPQNCLVTDASGTSAMPSKEALMDQAHDELIRCLNVSPTAYGQSPSGPGSKTN